MTALELTLTAAGQPRDAVFGRLVGGHHVDEALVTTLGTWWRSYLNQVARVSGEPVSFLPSVRSLRVTTELENMPEDQHPAAILVNEGLADTPAKLGAVNVGQAYTAQWRYRLGVQVIARDSRAPKDRVLRLAQMYVLAARGCLVQKRDAPRDSLLAMIDWIDEGYDGVPSNAERTTVLGWARFDVTVHDTVTWGVGPLDPVWPPDPPDPPEPEPQWPVAENVSAAIVKEPPEAQLEPEPAPLPDPEENP